MLPEFSKTKTQELSANFNFQIDISNWKLENQHKVFENDQLSVKVRFSSLGPTVNDHW